MKRISLLGICASPREHGNSRYLLQHALAAADGVSAGRVASNLYSFAHKEIGPCVSCFRCEELGDCAKRDDFQELRDAWMAADAII
jgi:multimeric flavodoxin WrbA